MNDKTANVFTEASELEAKAAEFTRLAKEKRQEGRAALVASLTQQAKDGGFSIGELFNLKREKKSSNGPTIRYRDPANADNTWTGRGRRPAWINAALEAGVDLQSFSVT